ncbi:F0F1 ATP synthase subunit gamma [Persephonella sp.]
MNSTKDIELKIKKFDDIRKIVISMKSIASLNLQKAQHIITSLRDYESEITDSLLKILSFFPDLSLSFSKGKKAVIVYGSDQGLCGLFNEKIGKEVLSKFLEDPDLAGFIAVGKKLDDIISEKKLKTFTSPIDYDSIYSYASELIDFITNLYVTEKIREIYVAYNQFSGIGKFRPTVKKIIPFEIKKKNFYRYPPVVDTDPAQILSDIIIEYIFANIYRSYLESFLSENGVRLMNMDNASKSIEKNIKKLEIERNYFRQEEITDEIQEIISAYRVITGE